MTLARRSGLMMLALLAALLLMAPPSAIADPLARLEGKGFEHYTLALTWHPGFCESRSDPPRECLDPSRQQDSRQGFVLHGLWPSLPDRFAAEGVDRRRWWAEGCFLEQPRADGSFCRAHPPFGLPDSLDDALDQAMPGRDSCLDRYQYAKHAACLDLPDDDYFAASVALVQAVNDSAFGAFVTLNQGGKVTRRDIESAFEAAFGEGTGRALRLECRGRGNRLLTEVRIGIDIDRLADFPAADSFFPQESGRCATRVHIATF